MKSGFESRQSHLLRKSVLQLLSISLDRMWADMRIPINRSTMVMGVADPYGCLLPDEIHLAFSSRLSDNSGFSLPYLHGEAALVGRHPAIRKSDLQKVSVEVCA